MMTTDAATLHLPPCTTRRTPRWRFLATLRAIKWARDARTPYTPYLADKAL